MKSLFAFATICLAIHLHAQVSKKPPLKETNWYSLLNSLIPDHAEDSNRSWRKTVDQNETVRWSTARQKKEKLWYEKKGQTRIYLKSEDLYFPSDLIIFGRDTSGYSAFEIQTHVIRYGVTFDLAKLLDQNNYSSKLLVSSKDGETQNPSFIYQVMIPNKKTVWLFINQVWEGRLSEEDPTPYDGLFIFCCFDKKECIERSKLHGDDLIASYVKPFLVN